MSTLNKFSGYAHWSIRIAVAGVFLFHGLQKLTNPGGGAMLGMSSLIWVLVGLAETGGGALILAGAFLPDWATRLGGLLIIPPMLGAIAKVHWGRWSFVPAEGYPMGGMEFQFTLLMLGLYFLLKGKGVEASEG